MFRVDPQNPFNGPHQTGQVLTTGPGPAEAEAAVILLHGRGASARSILMLAGELDEPGIHYAAPQAFQFTWYLHSFLAPVEQNQPGLNSGLQVIHDLAGSLEVKGQPRSRILIAGFSQGACLASEYVARHPDRYGGVVVLSGGLIGDTLNAENYSGSMEGTPVFLGCSDSDPHIPVERVHETERIFAGIGARVTKKIYPGMGHTVNMNELDQFKKMIRSVRSG